jgi:Nucleopolyhedrovirus p26 protein
MVVPVVFAFVLGLAVDGVSAMTTYNVNYTVNHLTQTTQIMTVDDEKVFIRTIPPHGYTTGADEYSVVHQFPGVATQIMFPAVSRSDDLYVLLNNGVLFRTQATRVYANFHVHKNRLIYGQLLTIAVDDFSIAAKIYVGAPIFRDKKLVSVVTCRYDDYTAGLALFPVSGVRPRGLVSGQYMFDDRVIVQELRAGNSVYGRQQLPYNSAKASVKNFALATVSNRQAYRDFPRSVCVFYDDNAITLTLVEGEFEMERVRFDGPLIVPQE